MKHIITTSKVRQAELNYEEMLDKLVCMVMPESEKCEPL